MKDTLSKIIRVVIFPSIILIISFSMYIGACYLFMEKSPWDTLLYYGWRLIIPMIIVYTGTLFSSFLLKKEITNNWILLLLILFIYTFFMTFIGYPYFGLMLLSPPKVNEPLHILAITTMVYFLYFMKKKYWFLSQFRRKKYF